MIVHLQGGEEALEPRGWKGCRAKWIGLACLHGGVFTRAQWTKFLGCHTEKVCRAVFVYAGPGYETTTALRSWDATSGRR